MVELIGNAEAQLSYNISKRKLQCRNTFTPSNFE